MVGQLEPRAVNPYHRGISAAITRAIYRLIVNNPVLLCVMVLAGEEIPDLIQRQAIDHPDTDDYLRRASIYHREEEARHIAFAGVLLPELWERASHRQRLLATHIAPLLIDLMLETQLCHPGIYEAAGLPGARTSRAVRRRPAYRQLRADGTRPVLKALKAAAPKVARRTPRGWRRITATA
jgi:peptidoglycan hydrolase-like protein with peptidoglycan-binding domain